MRYIEIKLDGTPIQMEPVTIRQYNNLVDTAVVKLKSDMDGLVVEDYNVFVQTDLVRRDKIPLTPCRSSVDIVVEEGYLGYTWPIDSAVTRYTGVLQFEVQLEHKTDAAIPIWQSEVCKLITVAPNICDNTALGDDGPAILQEVYQQLQTLDDKAEQTGEDRIATGADRSAVNTALLGFAETTLPAAIESVENKADSEIIRVGQAGDEQVLAVETAGAEQISLATEQADRAESEADKSTSQASKSESYAIGGTGTRPGEDEDNSKHYSEVAQSASESVATSAGAASSAKQAAETAQGKAEEAEQAAKGCADNAAQSNTAAGLSATAAGQAATQAGQSASDALASQNAAAISATDAEASNQNAATHEQAAKDYADAAAQSNTAAEQSATLAGQQADAALESKQAAAASANTTTSDRAAAAASAAAALASAQAASAAVDLQIIDDTTGTHYQFGADNGLIYLEEVTS